MSYVIRIPLPEQTVNQNLKIYTKRIDLKLSRTRDSKTNYRFSVCSHISLANQITKIQGEAIEGN